MRTKKTETKAPNAIDILQAAAKHMSNRAATYDKPEGERSMEKTIEIFNLYHGTNLKESDGWHLMGILKSVRQCQNPDVYHQDSAEDKIAYAALEAESLARGN